MRKTVIFSLCVFMLCLFVSLSGVGNAAYANSALKRFYGVDSAGVVMTDEESPVVVENEKLIFDISEFPDDGFDAEKLLSYDSKVTAEYTFYNPSEYTVTSTLVFPFGGIPYYYYLDIADFDDTHKYDVTIDGKPIEKKIRHTLSYDYSVFNLETELDKLCDGYVTDDFYSPKLTVTEYTYVIGEVDTPSDSSTFVAFDAKDLDGKTVICFPDMAISGSCYGTWLDYVRRKGTLVVYAIGEPLDKPIEWKFYLNINMTTDEEIKGEIKLEDEKTYTFEEFALSKRSKGSAVSDTDWYNAVVAELNSEQDGYIGRLKCISFSDSDIRYINQNMMRWYEYEITLSPGRRIVNAVTAPIYPTIDEYWEPPEYEYTYLLSPAKTWKEFGPIEIRINTPYYLISDRSNLEPERTENGYEKTLEGLPEEDLSFVLCSSPNPKRNNVSGAFFFVALFGIIIGGALIMGVPSIIAVIVVIVVLVQGKKKKKARQKNPPIGNGPTDNAFKQ